MRNVRRLVLSVSSSTFIPGIISQGSLRGVVQTFVLIGSVNRQWTGRRVSMDISAQSMVDCRSGMCWWTIARDLGVGYVGRKIVGVDALSRIRDIDGLRFILRNATV